VAATAQERKVQEKEFRRHRRCSPSMGGNGCHAAPPLGPQAQEKYEKKKGGRHQQRLPPLLAFEKENSKRKCYVEKVCRSTKEKEMGIRRQQRSPAPLPLLLPAAEAPQSSIASRTRQWGCSPATSAPRPTASAAAGPLGAPPAVHAYLSPQTLPLRRQCWALPVPLGAASLRQSRSMKDTLRWRMRRRRWGP
jgi:hypothetical protein